MDGSPTRSVILHWSGLARRRKDGKESLARWVIWVGTVTPEKDDLPVGNKRKKWTAEWSGYAGITWHLSGLGTEGIYPRICSFISAPYTRSVHLRELFVTWYFDFTAIDHFRLSSNSSWKMVAERVAKLDPFSSLSRITRWSIERRMVLINLS